MDERWLPVVGYEGFYEVSDQGRVRSVARIVNANKWKRPVRSKIRAQVLLKMYPAVHLSMEGKTKMRTVHVMLLEAFVGPRPSPAHEGCHGDGICTNNTLDNLRWDTKKANKSDSFAHGTAVHGEKCVHSKLSLQQAITAKWSEAPSEVLAKAFGVSTTAINRVRNGKTWSRAFAEAGV